MNLKEFNDNYVNILLQNISKKKNVFRLGDFNVDLIKCDKHARTNELLTHLFLYVFPIYLTSN